MTLTVAFQGIPGAYSEKAAHQFFQKHLLKCRPFPDFNSVYRAVEQGKVNFGILPIENSLTGSIHQNYDLLLSRKVKILGEVKLKISHCLLAGKNTKLSEIREIFSHPQALAQCERFIRGLAKAKPLPYFDTAGSARFVAASGRSEFAAIASAEAGRQYGLKTLRSNIADNVLNYTRFIIVAKPTKATASGSNAKPMKTSIVFALKSIPGALHKALSIFAFRDIDLLKIESRPIPGNPWQYIFYLDYQSPRPPETNERVLADLEEISVFTKVLGSYPIA